MKRARVLGAATALALALAPAGWGLANPNNHGNAANAPGQSVAFANCDALTTKQSDADIEAGGGPKGGVPAPTNCDHFFPPPGKGKP